MTIEEEQAAVYAAVGAGLSAWAGVEWLAWSLFEYASENVGLAARIWADAPWHQREKMMWWAVEAAGDDLVLPELRVEVLSLRQPLKEAAQIRNWLAHGQAVTRPGRGLVFGPPFGSWSRVIPELVDSATVRAQVAKLHVFSDVFGRAVIPIIFTVQPTVTRL